MKPATTSRERIVAIGLLVVVGAAFLLLGWTRIHAPFGDSDEGINAAVWALDSRALRELGPVESALGGHRADGSRYATHPPMLVVTTALAETVAGEHEGATRAAAWIGSLAAIGLLYALVRRTGASPLAAAGATAVACTTPMFLVYGPMLDTPVTAFPFGVGLVLLWWRDWEGKDPPAWWAIGLVALLACLASWQSALLVGILCVGFAIRAVRSRSAGVLAGTVPYAVGGAVGVALSLGWTRWAHGSFEVLTDKFLRRSGGSSQVAFADVLTFQGPWIFNLLGLGVIGLAGCVAALWDRRLRPLAAVSLAVTFGYALVFREAAAGHQYWLYWELLPVGVGGGWLLTKLETDLRSHGDRVRIGMVLGACLVIALFDVAKPDNAEPLIEDGWRSVALVRSLPPGTDLHYVGEEYRPDPWVQYYTGRTPRFLTSADEVARLAAADPATPVLVLGECGDHDPSAAFCRRATGLPADGSGPAEPPPPRLVRAADLAGQLGTGGT